MQHHPARRRSAADAAIEAILADLGERRVPPTLTNIIARATDLGHGQRSVRRIESLARRKLAIRQEVAHG